MNPLPTDRVEYAGRRMDLTEKWLKDHKESMRCQMYEDLLSDWNALLLNLWQFDNELQEAYFEGIEHDEQLSENLKQLFERWLETAKQLEASVRDRFEPSYQVEHIDELRKGIREVQAAVYSSDSASEQLENMASQEVARGKYTEGLIDE